MKSALIFFTTLLLLSACSSSPTTSDPATMDLPAYRVYIGNINRTVRIADADSFEIGEQARLVSVSDQILAALGEADAFEALSGETRLDVSTWNDELHVLMMGINENRSTGRICRTDSTTGSNIRSRTCRTRAQLARDREAAKLLLLERSDSVDRIILDDLTRPVTGFGTPDLNN